MRGFLSGVGRVLKCLFVCFLLLLAFLVVNLLFFEQRIPRLVLDRIAAAMSGGGMVVHMGAASFRFAHGLVVEDFRVSDAARPTARPVVSARKADLELDLCRVPWSLDSMLRHVTLVDFEYPRLPEGYYIPDSIEFPGQPDFKEKNEPVSLSLPTIRSFGVTLHNPDILGVTPRRVDVAGVSFTPERMKADGIRIQWRDQDVSMALDGEAELDLKGQVVRGEVRGHARPANIVPMLERIDITNALPFIASFSHIEKPVDALCRFDVNLVNNDLHIFLDLTPRGGRHNGVPLDVVHGTIDIRVFVRDTYQNADIKIGPIDARLADGTAMDGTLRYFNTNDVGYVDFDVRSSTSLSNALAIADVLNDGALDCVAPETPPRITLSGRLAVDPAHASANDLHGTVAFEKGSFFSIPLRSASTEFHVKGTDVAFTNAHAAGPSGGAISCHALLSIPEFRQDNATYSVSVDGRGVALGDLADVFSFDIGDRHGVVDGAVTLAGPIRTNSLDRLCGGGRISCKDGYLAQMNVFSGLTDTLARHVPGLPVVVNQSKGSLDFTITNGVFRSSNVLVDGKVFSIHAAGAYDIPNDRLDVKANASFTRPEEWYTKITAPLSWSLDGLSKLLLEVKIEGPLEKPVTTYNREKFTGWLEKIRVRK